MLTRHEMQQWCPDILVTNYSMLEYMLMRPIERNLFKQTQEWLAADPANIFILVLDEAHVYRGVGGAEVALLIRRLQARLGIPRERFRCILTSASLGADSNHSALLDFATRLTGSLSAGHPSFQLIQGTQAQRPPVRTGTTREAVSLASCDLTAFFQRTTDLASARNAIDQVAKLLDWPTPPTADQTEASEQDEELLRAYLYNHLYGFGPLEWLIQKSTEHALAFDELAWQIFPEVEQKQAESATTTLLALGTYARRDGQALLPTRLHLFFRGLPTLYACINPCCEERRHQPGASHLLGRLYAEPRTHCTCQAQARVYELYTHRQCGAAFLRVFGQGDKANFYWHEQGGNVAHVGQPLDETLLLLEKPHPSQLKKMEQIWLDIAISNFLTLISTSLLTRVGIGSLRHSINRLSCAN